MEVGLMPKQSGYLQRQAAREQAIIDAVDQTVRQLMLDTLQITLHTEYGCGFDRIKALSEAWAKVYNQLHGAVERGPEQDVAQEHLDRALLEIMRGKQELIPFPERYPHLREIKYGR